jgi:PrtD family type I secretion system ABC transporter
LALDNLITSGSIIAASILTARALSPFDAAISTWKMLLEARKSYSRLNDSLRRIEQPEGGISLPPPLGHLTIENLVYVAPSSQKVILRNLSFDLEAGEILGIIGPSAAGKSTLARLIVGSWIPYGGSVRLDGYEVHRWKREEFGSYVGYLPQDVELFNGTVRDNIARMHLDVPDDIIVQAAQAADAHELIMHLPQGYDTDIGPGGAALSAGQRQRIGLARAFLGQPRLLVLDEPDANLDGDGEAALIHALKHSRQQGITTILVTHRKFLLNYVTRLLVLKDGRRSLYGPTRDVMSVMQENKLAKEHSRATPKLAEESDPSTERWNAMA